MNNNPSQRSWAFTLNNYTDNDIAWLNGLSDCVTKLVVGKEVGESGTPHLQGFVTFKNTKRFNTLKKLNERVHWEAARQDDGDVYINKVDTDVVIKINNKEQGKRSDLDEVAEFVKNKKRRSEIAKSLPKAVIKYGQGIERLMRWSTLDEEKPKPVVIWCHGPSGSGKSRYVREREKKEELYAITTGEGNEQLKFFGEYNPYEHKAVVFDDLEPSNINWKFLLQLLDVYDMFVQTKGGFVKWVPERIYITCLMNPSNWASMKSEEDKYQLERRINHIYEFTKDPEVPNPRFNEDLDLLFT